MTKILRLFILAIAVLFVCLLAFTYLPIPGLAASDLEDNIFEERADQFFSLIASSKGLQRPFPEMKMRTDNPDTPDKIELGKLLYFDPLLSGKNDISCAHCHHPDLGFSDNRAISMGKDASGLGRDREGGAVLRRGSPTVWNSAFNHLQFWDGRAADLEEQAGKPIEDKKEMDQDPAELLKELKEIPAYVELFKKAFHSSDGESLTFENVTYAIAAFERTIISQNSRFDRYAAGEVDALDARERAGLNVFRSLETRCFECHNFPTFANPDFKIVGVPDLDVNDPDLGRGEIVGEIYNRAFKVPTLRNIALTAPYMHNGVFETLEEVIDFYAKGGGNGLGMNLENIDDKIRPFSLTAEEKSSLIAFLHALTDESAKPDIPASVPSGLPVVPSLANQSPELAAYNPPPLSPPNRNIERNGQQIIVKAGQRIQDGLDLASPGDTVVVMPGEYHETLTVDMSNITLLGKRVGDDIPVLDGNNVLPDGLVGAGSDFEIRNFVVRNFTANGIMLDGARNVTFREVICENPGLYGIYPVGCVGVTVEGCSVTGARDAGIYVGQSKDIIVKNSKAFANVTGIEIENSLNAIVEDNEVTDNAGGILVFLLPNNPSKISRNCIVRNNKVIANNHVNFGDPAAIVSRVPSGSGIMLLGADEVEVTGNQIEENNSFGIALIHLNMVYGNGTNYDVDPVPENNWIHGNHFANNGKSPDGIIKDAGYDGRDLLWDLSGSGNFWDEPTATKLPPTLPSKNWSGFREQLTVRFWKLLGMIAG